jgi:hypothetical protein
VYGIGVLGTSLSFRLHRMGLRRSALFDDGEERRLGRMAPQPF